MTTLALPGVEQRGSAVVSDCGRYRYLLTRGVPSADRALWIMLNPSTANAEQDDPTTRRCRDFSRQWGLGAIALCNLFAFRATSPRGLADAIGRGIDAVGPEADVHIESAARAERTKRIVLGWGLWHRRAHGRALEVYRLLRRVRPDLQPMCLGMTSDGSPRHPLYVRGDTLPTPWGAGPFVVALTETR